MNIMKLYLEGEKSSAVCSFCKQVNSTTFRERDVPLRSGKGIVRDVLVSVCDHCDRVVGIPQQSVPRISESTRGGVRHPIEARIPRQLSDVMGLVCHEIEAPNSEAALFRFYVNRISKQGEYSSLAKLAKSIEAGGKASARFSTKLNDVVYGRFRELTDRTQLKPADVVKGIIVKIKHEVLDKRNERLRCELRNILQIAT